MCVTVFLFCNVYVCCHVHVQCVCVLMLIYMICMCAFMHTYMTASGVTPPVLDPALIHFGFSFCFKDRLVAGLAGQPDPGICGLCLLSVGVKAYAMGPGLLTHARKASTSLADLTHSSACRTPSRLLLFFHF